MKRNVQDNQDNNEEEAWTIRMGRYREEDEREIERLFHMPRFRYGYQHIQIVRSKEVALWRSRTIENGWRWSAGPQAVVTSVGHTKAIRGVRAMIRYVARIRPEDERKGQFGCVQLYDELGRKVAAEDAVKRTKEWGLLRNQENLSRISREWAARKESNNIERLKKSERLHYVQSWHFVFSIKSSEEDEEADSELLQRSILVMVARVFGQEGHGAIWCIHRDKKEHPHAHVIVAAKSKFGERIRCDRQGDYLYWLRIQFAKELKTSGLDFDASRREDRFILRSKILEGTEPFRTPDHFLGKYGSGGNLMERSPNWWRVYGDGNSGMEKIINVTLPEADRIIDAFTRSVKQNLITDQMAGDRLRELFKSIFRKPQEAWDSWASLAEENARQDKKGHLMFPNLMVACWHLKKKPGIFGEVRGANNIKDLYGDVPGHVLRAARSLGRVATFSRKLLLNDIRSKKIETLVEEVYDSVKIQGPLKRDGGRAILWRILGKAVKRPRIYVKEEKQIENKKIKAPPANRDVPIATKRQMVRTGTKRKEREI